MRVLVFAPSFAPAVKAGGPARSLTNLVKETAQHHDVTVVASDRDHLDTVPFEGLSGQWTQANGANVFYLNPQSPRQWGTLLRTLPSRRFDLVLLNSVWDWGFSMVPATLLATRVLRGPAVLMPRGELEPGALALKRRKKNLVRPVVVPVYRRVVSAVGVTSLSEAGNASTWFPGSPVLTTTNSPDPIEFGAPDREHGEFRVVGIGRVHPTKGLLPLLAGLKHTTRSVDVRWFGAVGDASYWQQCRREMAELPEHVRFQYSGEARREEIPGILHDADLMVLLTAGENFGHSIAEALQAGCPVLTTPTTPWTGVLGEGGGELVSDREDAASVGRAIDRWSMLTAEERAAARLASRRAFDQFAATQPPNIIELGLQAIAPELTDSRDPASHGSGPLSRPLRRWYRRRQERAKR